MAQQFGLFDTALPFQVGVATLTANKDWQSFSYPSAFSTAPQVLGFANSRTTTYSIPTFSMPDVQLPASPGVPQITIPNISIPSVTIPDVYISRVGREDLRQRCYEIAYNNAVSRLGDWQIGKQFSFGYVGIDVNWLRDKVAGAFGNVGYGIGWALNFLWDSFIQPQIDQVQNTIINTKNQIRSSVQNSLNSAIGNVNTGLGSAKTSIQNGINQSITNLNNEIVDLRNKTNNVFKEVNAGLSRAINSAITEIITKMGLDANQTLSPINIRNVTPTKFEVKGLGSQLQFVWLAITNQSAGSSSLIPNVKLW